MTHFWHWQKQLSPKMVCPSTCIALLVVNFEAKRSGSAASGLPNPTPLWEGEVGFPEAQDQQKVFTHPPDTELKFVMPKLKLSSNWHVYIYYTCIAYLSYFLAVSLPVDSEHWKTSWASQLPSLLKFTLEQNAWLKTITCT